MMVWLTISGDILFENSLIYGDGVLDYILGKDTFFMSVAIFPTNCHGSAGSSLSYLIFAESSFILSFLLLATNIPIEINCRPPGGAILDMMNL
jgi:hypothetical protein